MIGNLEQRVDGEVFILDTNIVTPPEKDSLNDILYNGLEGLESLPRDLLSRRTERVREIVDLTQKGNLLVLKEVLEETTADWETLNKNIKHFKGKSEHEDYQRDSIKELEEYSFEKFKLLKKIGRKEYRLGFLDDLDRSKQISAALECGRKIFVDHISLKYRLEFERILSKKEHSFNIPSEDYQGKFKVNFYTYIGFLKMALDSSHKCKIAALDHARKLNSPSCKGLLLDTDSKIVAAAFALSEIYPVTILTKDKGMNYQIEQVMYLLKDEGKRSHYKIACAPSRKISVLNPEKSLEVTSPQIN